MRQVESTLTHTHTHTQQINAEVVHVPCLVGMATALQILKATPKARNHLKRVSKANYNQDEV